MKKQSLKEAKEIIAYLCHQFGYKTTVAGIPMLSSGALSSLEIAFDFLGWPPLLPCPDNKCQVKGCNEWIMAGMRTKAGYKLVCGKHFSQRRGNRYD